MNTSRTPPRSHTTVLHQGDWYMIAFLIVSAGLLLWAAPSERTLGAGIKLVYVHVAMTWTGMLGLTLAGVIGLGVALLGRPPLLAWARKVGWTAGGFFAAGLLTSALAAWVNWGGVFWAEPRMQTALNGLVLALVALVASGWLPWRRAGGALLAVPPVFLAWSTSSATLVLHPRSPILSSSSPGIQLAFLGSFALCLAAAAWLVLRRTEA